MYYVTDKYARPKNSHNTTLSMCQNFVKYVNRLTGVFLYVNMTNNEDSMGLFGTEWQSKIENG